MNYKRVLPGRRFVRFILSLALIWGIVTLVYLFIPSFNPKDSTITDLLEFQGEKVTRVYETESFFIRPDCPSRPYPWPRRPDGECEGVSVPPALERFLNQWVNNAIFELQVTQENGTQYLTMGGGKNPFLELPFDLGFTPFTENRIALNFDGLAHDEIATISEPFSVRVATTSYASWLVPRWLSAADIALITWWYDSRNSVEVPLRVLRDPSKGILEVWPEHWDWANFPYSQTTPSTVRPLISVKIPSIDNRAHFYDSLPEYPISSSPTPYTLRARLILLLFIIPVGVLWYALVIIVGTPFTLGAVLFSTIISILVNVLAFLVVIALIYAVVSWFRLGRPPLAELGQRSGVGLHGQWGRPTGAGVGGTVTYIYGISVSINRPPAASPSVSLEGLERDLEVGIDNEAQPSSLSKGNQTPSQQD